jgi:hypothetical protein
MATMIELLLSRTGQIVTLTTKRAVKVRKGCQPVDKVSTFQARIGVNYDHIKDVIVKREAGELPEENAGLPYGKWVKFPYLLEHNGVQYLRCTAMDSKMRIAPKYYRDGKEVSVEVVKPDALASEFTDRDGLEVFNVKVDSIVDVK